MNQQTRYRFSLALNFIFVCFVLYIAYRKREKIYNKLHPNRTYQIVMFGNSLTGGGNWDAYLGRKDIKNSGYSGFTTSHFAVMTNSDVIPFNPKICFIEGGMNDIGCGIPMERIRSNYVMIIDSLLKYNIRPVIQSTLYCIHPDDSLENANVDTINVFLRSLAISRKVRYMNLNPLLAKDGRLNPEHTTNGYHLSESGYHIWAEEIRKILAEEKI